MKLALVYFGSDGYVNRGVGYVASSILEAGYDLTFINIKFEPDPLKKLVSDGYDLLMLSASTLFYNQAKQLARAVKSKIKIPILLGGLHSIIMRYGILDANKDIDYLCVGEGEVFIKEFLSKFGTDALYNIDNLGYRNGDGAVINQVAPPTNLDQLPRFRYDLWEPSAVIQPYPLPGFCYVYASRGCPFNCYYCSNSVYLNIYGRKNYLRYRSIDNTIAELKWLKAHYQVEFFYFGDEMMITNYQYVSELFHRVQTDIQLPYGCMARVEVVDQKLVDLWRTTGCQYVGMGVECGDESFRREWLNRKMSNETIINAFKLVKTIPGITITAYNMKEYPVPWDEDLLRCTNALNKKLMVNRQMSTYMPFPRTVLGDFCFRHNLVDRDRWDVADSTFVPSTLNRERVNQLPPDIKVND